MESNPFEFFYIEDFLSEEDFKLINNQSCLKSKGDNFDILNKYLMDKGWSHH